MKKHIYPGSIIMLFAVFLGLTAPFSTAFAQSGPPIIQSATTNQTVPLGSTADFSVSASGSSLSYQWYFNNNNLAGATNASLVIAPALTNDDGSYQVIVTNVGGSATSAVATLTVLVEPNIYGISNSAASNSTLLSLASYPGSANYMYVSTNLILPFSQWQLVATNLAGTSGLFQWLDTNTQGVPAKFYRFASQMGPAISSVSAYQDEVGEFQTITISGSCFGNQGAYNSDSDYFEIDDVTAGWQTGYPNQLDGLFPLNITSWSTNQITILQNISSEPRTVFNPGDTLNISVWNPQTGAGPATYSTPLEMNPVISSVSTIEAEQDQLITISGRGLGNQNTVTGDSTYLELDDVTGGWEADYPRDHSEANLSIASWTESQIVFSEFGNPSVDNLNGGDYVTISVWNPQGDLGPATYNTIVQGPIINSVSTIFNEQYQTITISGSGFGAGGQPVTGPYFEIEDVTAGWQTGLSFDENAVTPNIASWTTNQIVLSGFGGVYGESNLTLNAGDTVIISVSNPETGAGPASHTNTVQAPLSLSSVSPIQAEPTQTITISGGGFGTQGAYDGDSDYIEINDVTGGWTAGKTGNTIGLNVTSWTTNQIVLSGFTGDYGATNGSQGAPWALNLGDTVVISVWNAQRDFGPVTYSTTVVGPPVISNVSPIVNTPAQTITITGSEFGTNSPDTNTDSDYLEIEDITAGWSAGHTGNGVTLNVTNWTPNQITLGGFAGAYGESNQTLNVGDTVIISVWNPQTGFGPATYTNIVAVGPVISSVSNITNGPTQTITITGSEFGTNSPYTNADSDYLEIDDVTGGWSAGHAIGNQTNGITLDVASWTTNQITLSGFAGEYGAPDGPHGAPWILNVGDTVVISVWNAQTGAGPATYTNTVQPLPVISSVSIVQAKQSQTITISGSDFGTYSPYTNGDSDYIYFKDDTIGWQAGNTGNTITLGVTSWTTNRIVLSGFGGSYGSGNLSLNAGDTFSIGVWNPQTGLGPATYSNTVLAAVSIGNVSPIKTNQTQTITISGSGFGTNTPYNGDSDYLEIDDVTGGWSAGSASKNSEITLNVTSWTTNQIVLSGFTGAYGGQWSLNAGDTLTFSVSNPQTGAGATYTTTVEIPPAISSVSTIVNEKTQTITISGSNFGTNSPYNGDSDYLEVEDVTAGGWNAGYTGNTIQLDVTSWTTNQIVLSGFGGDYGSENFNLNGGDTVIISLWDPQTGLGPAFYTNIVQGPPAITSVSGITNGPTQTIIISGSGFGTNNPYSGDSDYISFKDDTLGWTAGNSNNTITLSVTSWTPDQIVLSGLGGSYGSGNFNLNPGDSVTIGVWNPQTGVGPATSSTIVQGLPAISSVSAIQAEQSQTITISGNWFGTSSPYNGDSDYLEIDDVTAGWSAGSAAQNNGITLNVTSWTTNQITLSGFTGSYGDPQRPLNTGDELIIYVRNAQTGFGPAAYTNIVELTPAISSAGPIINQQTQTITISGSGFGTNSSYTNADSAYIEIDDITGNWRAGNTGNGVTLDVTSWTTNQITIGGFKGAYGDPWTLNAGDTVVISIWNPQLGTGPGIYTTTVQGPPVISSVSGIVNKQTQTITISGSEFGTNSPYNGDSDYIEITDETAGWNAGYGNNTITLGVTNWASNQITLSGFGGSYGSGNFNLNVGDTVVIGVWNPQTGLGPVTYTNIVQAPPAISSVSTIQAKQTQTITITGSEFGTNSPYTNGDSDYIEIQDITANWSAGYLGDQVSLDVVSWTTNQIILSGFAGDYGAWILNGGDTVVISVWDAKTGAGPATYTNIVQGPVISSVSAVQPGQNQTITISGSDFGTNSPFTNADSDYLEVQDVTANWSAGYLSATITLDVTSWTTNQIVLGGFGGAFSENYSLNIGDTVIFTVWNPQTGTGPATYTNIVQGPPAISNVSPIINEQTQIITISGSNLGINSPYTNADSDYIEIHDVTANWNAGYTSNGVTLDVTSWTLNQIVLSGFDGSYGSYNLNKGDTVIISVWNAETGVGPATYTNTVQGPVAISNVSPIVNEQTQTITISGNGFGTTNAYDGDSDYIDIEDVTANWNAGYTGDALTLGVTSWTPNQIVLSGFTGPYGDSLRPLSEGDTVVISVWNAQTDAGPATYTNTVIFGQ